MQEWGKEQREGDWRKDDYIGLSDTEKLAADNT